MKNRSPLCTLPALLSLVLTAAVLCTVVYAMDAQPVILRSDDAPRLQAQGLMDTICSGDPSGAGAYLYGTPTLGAAPEDSSTAVEMLWNAYLESLEYTFAGDCYATHSGIAVDVTVRHLDLAGLLSGLDSKTQELLDKRLAAGSSRDMFDENDQLRQEQLERILSDAVLLLLAQPRETMEQTITLSMTFENGRWWILPEEPLLDILAGSLAG